LIIFTYSSFENNNNYDDDYNDNKNNDYGDGDISCVVLSMLVFSIYSSGHFLKTTACLFTGFNGLAYAPELALVLKYPTYENNCF
jgi:hypothetical protein